MQCVSLSSDGNGMTGIVATSKTRHQVGLFGQPVYDLPFSFIAPLGAYDNGGWHKSAPLNNLNSKNPTNTAFCRT
jgi:hypothetical protein